MENLQQKAAFLKNGFTAALSGLDTNTPGKWGKMNVQQMIEHMSDYVRVANGRTPMEIMTPEEKILRMQGFLESEKSFQENTPNAFMPDIPAPVKHATKEEAISELQGEINHFFTVYEKEQDKKIANPFFGQLTFDQQVQLLHKHATHHLRQFGAVE